MFPPQLFTTILALQPASPDPPLPESFAPVRAEVTAADQGMEILAYDDRGEVVGVLRATPEGDRIRIEADFDDGYATLQLSPDEPDGSTVLTDLEQTAAVGRVSQMFSFAAQPQGPQEATRRECMWAFATIAGACGAGALYPLLGAAILPECLFGIAATICECGEHLPINVC